MGRGHVVQIRAFRVVWSRFDCGMHVTRQALPVFTSSRTMGHAYRAQPDALHLAPWGVIPSPARVVSQVAASPYTTGGGGTAKTRERVGEDQQSGGHS